MFELALLPRISITSESPLPLSEISGSRWVLWYLVRQGNIQGGCQQIEIKMILLLIFAQSETMTLNPHS